jgi:plastocyanin
MNPENHTTTVSSDNLPPDKSSSKRLFLLGCAVLLVIIAASIIVIVRHKSTSTTRQALIQITASGFVPDTLHVKAGTVIKWQNYDVSPHHVASNPYPADNSFSALNSHTMAAGSSYNFQVNKTQTIQYHDDNVPTHNGTIVVE